MSHFVVVYDRLTGRMRLDRFDGEDSAAEAVNARLTAESTAGPDEEVTVLAASSEDDLRETHARYFQGPSELLDELQRVAGR